jgi:hypothetical protein
MNPTHRFRLEWLALWTGLLPFIVINLAYLSSAIGGHIPACIPYVAGCTTISSAGRYGLSYYFFKAGMIPSAVLLAVFWIICRRWLIELGDENRAMARSIAVLGILAAVFLVLYTIFLGSRGDFYFLMRRFGVTLYFGFSGLAQILLLARLQHLREKGAHQIPNRLLRQMLLVLLGLLIIGLASIPISNFIVDKHRPRNIVEWNFSLLMIGYYILVWRAWRATSFHPTISIARLPGSA